jgi:membrane protein YdbS with pleckstrin-like domain
MHPVPHEEEHELWHGNYSPRAMYGGWVLALVVTVAGIALSVLVPNPAAWIAAAVAIPAIWLAALVTLIYRRLSVDYTLTTQRFLHKRGLLRRVANQILLVDIDDVAYEQGLIDRFVNVGTITLHSNDASDPKLPLRGIENVEQVANRIDEARREERRKRAIYMANA